MFTIFNTILLSFVVKNRTIYQLQVAFVYILMFVVLLWTNFEFKANTPYTTLATVILCMVYSLVLIPSFNMITQKLAEESLEEQRISRQKETQFKQMFDYLQKGLIVLQRKKLFFINDLARNIIDLVTDFKEKRKLEEKEMDQ